MATTGILGNLFGSASTEVQIPAASVPKKPDAANPFDIEKAKAGNGKFPPQPELFVNTARTSGHLSNIALATLISTAGYTLQDALSLWNSGDISDQSTYIVITHGILPPRDMLRYVYSAALLSTQLPTIPQAADHSESVVYVEMGQSFVVNVPQGFHVYVFCSAASLVEARTMPEELANGDGAITLQVQRHTVGGSKSDNSVDHTFTFMQRVAAFSKKSLPPLPSGLLRFIARAELIRI